MNRKRFISSLLFIIVLSTVVGYAVENTEDLSKRNFLFQIGAGPSYISYGSELDSIISDADLYGISRMQLNLNFGFGWAVSEKDYILLSVNGLGDRYDDGYDHIQLNSYLYAVGLRRYPFDTGLVFGIDAGLGKEVFQSSFGDEYISPSGFGLGLVAAYDFTRNPTGFGIEIGIRLDRIVIEQEAVAGASLFLDLLWK